ncbi:MAG: hypothetical protein QXO35_01455 [Candidatus Micrarchaeia archaeon]
MVLKMKETVKSFEQNKINKSIEQLEKSTQSAMNSLKNVPGLVIISENDLSKIFSELKEKAKKIKTEEDKKKFFEHYSLVASMCQSYIEAANDWQSIKEAGLKAVSFYLGVDEKSTESPSSAIISSAFIALGVGQFKKIKDLKNIAKAEKIKELEKTAPNTARALIRLGEKIDEYEKKINGLIAKEKEFLISLAKGRLRSIGLRSVAEVKTFFSDQNVIKTMKEMDSNSRKSFIIKNIINEEDLLIKESDPIEIKRQKELVRNLLFHLKTSEHLPLGKLSSEKSIEMKEIISNYIVKGGTEIEANKILSEISTRIQYAGKQIGELWLKSDLNDEVFRGISHDFRDLFSTISMFRELLSAQIKKHVMI